MFGTLWQKTGARFFTAPLTAIVYNLRGAGVDLRSVCAPGFNCHGCPQASYACPVGVLTFSSAIHAIPFYVIGTVLLIGLILGRLVCGFLCPFGWLQDLLYRIPVPKIRLPRWTRYGKYLALLLLVFLLPALLGFEEKGYVHIQSEIGTSDMSVRLVNLGNAPVEAPELQISIVNPDTDAPYFEQALTFPDVVIEPGETHALAPIPYPPHPPNAEFRIASPQTRTYAPPRYDLYYCRLCPVGTLEASIPASLAAEEGGVHGFGRSSRRLVIFGGFILLIVVASRAFCRTFCPLGAMYGLFARISLFRMRLRSDRCIDCGKCDRVCPVELDVRREVGGAECIACGDCKRACPVHAIERIVGFEDPRPIATDSAKGKGRGTPKPNPAEEAAG